MILGLPWKERAPLDGLSKPDWVQQEEGSSGRILVLNISWQSQVSANKSHVFRLQLSSLVPEGRSERASHCYQEAQQSKEIAGILLSKVTWILQSATLHLIHMVECETWYDSWWEKPQGGIPFTTQPPLYFWDVSVVCVLPSSSQETQA